jgi:thermolabile hemolysin
MRLYRVLLLTVLSLVGWISLARADYVQIVSFGDSLSDTGNLFAASGGAAAPAPYYKGHFSNGPIWLESLAGKLGVANPTPSIAGGANYAWASAESGTGVSASYGVPNLLTQVNGFTLKNKLTSKDLVTIWAGGNDFLHGQTNPFVPANNIATAITALAKAGGKTWPGSKTPIFG